MGEAVIAAAAGILGAALAGYATYKIQLLSLDRTEKSAAAAQRRQDRINAYSAFPSGVLEYRRTALHRLKSGASDDSEIAQDTRRARSAAYGSWYRVALLSEGTRLTKMGEQILTSIDEIEEIDPDDKAQLDGWRDGLRENLVVFQEMAASELKDGIKNPR